jgi:hypothetical protein
MAEMQGHVRIPNRLYEAITEAPFTDVQRRIVLVLVRQTLGWGRQTVEISTPEIARALNHEVTGSFRAALSDLIVSGVLEQLVRGDGKTRSVYRVETEYEAWGRFAIANARLAAKWGERPRHRDDMLAVSRDGGGGTAAADADDGNSEGDSEGSPSIVTGGALEQAPRGAHQQAGRVPASRQTGGPPAGTPTEAKSSSSESYGRGKTVKDSERQLHNTNTTNARASDGASVQAGAQKQAPSFDVSGLPRFAEFIASGKTDVERLALRNFLERQASADEARRWIPRLSNWLAGEMVPPAWKGKLTVEILAAALDEYSGTFAVRHVQAFVEDVMRRFTAEPGSRSAAVTGVVESKLDAWAAESAAREKISA